MQMIKTASRDLDTDCSEEDRG